MAVQKASAKETIARCHALGTKVVAGGPLFSSEYEGFDEVDHLVLDEAEITLPPFLADLEKGQARHVYSSGERPDITGTPIPLWSLIDTGRYGSMNIQYSRGCPHDCEFCCVVTLNGHKPRTKTAEQMLAEMDALYDAGWRGILLIVDDNFLGNKKKLKAEVLPAMIRWAEARKHPLSLLTQTSIALADDEELMRLMVRAGFNQVFIGIETTNEESLAECRKFTNKNRDLVADVRRIHSFGMEVQAGFIVGFDSDPPSIFRSQIDFIQSSGVVTAMVGLLNAPRGSRLYQRLVQENRLLKDPTGDNTDCSINFIPSMAQETLISGYRHILDTIYAPKQHCKRISTFLRAYKPPRVWMRSYLRRGYISGFFKSVWVLGITDSGRVHYWRLFVSTLFRRPRLLPLSVVLSIYGVHFRRVIHDFAITTAIAAPASPSFVK